MCLLYVERAIPGTSGLEFKNLTQTTCDISWVMNDVGDKFIAVREYLITLSFFTTDGTKAKQIKRYSTSSE